MKEFKKINKEALSNRIVITRMIFLKGLSIIYLIAFLSLYGQIQGLWGNEGLFPSSLFLEKLKEKLAGHHYYLFYPSLVWLLNTNINSNSIENLLYILCLLGIILSLGIIFYDQYFLNSVNFLILCYIHYNFTILGQSFMNFAWDGLLNEIGFASIFFAPMSFRHVNYIYHINNIMFYYLKFILFKFMVSTGINIIGSQCPYWTSFTGLSFFFQGQPLLSSFSYFFKKILNDNFSKILSAFGYFCILYLPIGYFLVWRRFSIYTGQITFLFNIFFIFAGNYGFLNLLIIILNSLNFDDYFYRSVISKRILVILKLDYLSPLIPLYFAEKKELDDETNKNEKELQRIQGEIDKENEKKEKKDEKRIKELTSEYNQIRKKLFSLMDDDFEDSPRIEETFTIQSSLLKECFIFINFLCANLLFVYLVLYPIKRLVKGMTVIQQLSKYNFKSTIIFASIYIFAYIIIGYFINLVFGMKFALFSENSIMSSVMDEIIEKNNKKDPKDTKDIKEEIKKSLNKKNYWKLLSRALVSLFKMSRYMAFLIIFAIYFLGSVKYFLLSIDVDIIEKKTNDNNKSKDKDPIDEIEEPGTIQNFLFLSDLLFSNFNVFGVYGNTQGEILSTLGRSEIEIEYTTEKSPNSWKTINFEYKLGPENSVPKFLFFYMPRLDWKISNAAYDENLNNDSWLILLLGKIFEKNPVVMDLLGYEIEEKKIFYKISLFDKIKSIYMGKKRYELMSTINKLKMDVFKYKFLKNNEIKEDRSIFQRKRYKEYLSPIEKHTLFMVYEKLGLPKPDIKRKIKINKFQYIPVIDLVLIFILAILLKKNN